MADAYKKIIGLAVALIIIAVIFPIALGLIGNAGNIVVTTTGGAGLNETLTLSEVIDPTVLVLLVTLLPIIAIIAVVMMFLPKNKNS